MTALRGIRGVIAAPFYLIVSPVVSIAFAVITALAMGTIERETLTDILSGEQWLRLAAKAWVVMLGGLAAGLISGSMGLQGARPSIDYDTGAPWLGRATRSMVSATVAGVAVALAMFLLRAYVGRWAVIVLVVLLVIVAVISVLVAAIRIPLGGKGRRGGGRSEAERQDEDLPIPRIQH